MTTRANALALSHAYVGARGRRLRRKGIPVEWTRRWLIVMGFEEYRMSTVCAVAREEKTVKNWLDSPDFLSGECGVGWVDTCLAKTHWQQ